MNQFNRTAYDARTLDTSVDAGLRSFMLGVYNKMGLGLLLSAAIAYVVGTVAPVTQLVFGTPLLFVVQFGPIALLFGSMFFMRNPSPTGAALLYWSVVSLIGASLGMWVMIAANSDMAAGIAGGGQIGIDFGTIAQALVITSAAFFGLSLFGYTTKMNLGPLRSFLFMGMIGVIAIALLNTFFINSGPLHWIIQFAILGLMSGVVAWQTQNLKITYFEIQGDERSMAVATTFAALNLYIAFINMFQVILMLLGNRE